MTYEFYKYQGTGNDFVIIDNRQQLFDKNNTKQIARICDRRFGIGADGLILLENDIQSDFKMVYFNSDGQESSMCGNGGRCITAFANYLGIIEDSATFLAIDGLHDSIIENDVIKLKMQDVPKVENHDTHVFLDTGSPHHVQLASDLGNLDIKKEGSKIRYGQPYGEVGVNVNFVSKINDNKFAVRTYERGVEDETLSCGTGVTGVALAMHFIGETEKNMVDLETEGGTLTITFRATPNGYKDIWLIGPAVQVYKGEWND